MATTPTVEEMKKRVARFKALKPHKAAFLDHVYSKKRARHLQHYRPRRVSEDLGGPQPEITAVDGFNVQMAGCKPGHGNGLHAHVTVETFLSLSSRWAVRWGDRAENEIVLEQFDLISVPPGVMRCFENIGEGVRLPDGDPRRHRSRTPHLASTAPARREGERLGARCQGGHSEGRPHDSRLMNKKRPVPSVAAKTVHKEETCRASVFSSRSPRPSSPAARSRPVGSAGEKDPYRVRELQRRAQLWCDRAAQRPGGGEAAPRHRDDLLRQQERRGALR